MSITTCEDCRTYINTDYTIPHEAENGDQLCEGCYIDREEANDE